MEQGPVGVDGRSSLERLLQPGIVTIGKPLERETAHFAEFVSVVLERVIAKNTARLSAKRQGRFPCRLLDCGRRSILERDALIPTLHRCDVSQKGANRVARVVVQMIELSDAQSFDGGKCGFAGVEEHAHQPPDDGCVTWQRLDPKRW